jgi:hypothetical protein
MHEADIAAIPHRALKRYLEVDDLQLVLDERTTGFAIYSAQLDVSELCMVTFAQQMGTEIGERVHHWSRACGRIVVELRTRAIDISGMKESQQAVVSPIERSTDERRDVGRS